MDLPHALFPQESPPPLHRRKSISIKENHDALLSIRTIFIRNSISYAISLLLRKNRAVKDRGLPFSLAMIHAVTTVANHFENFRYRFLNGDVVLYEVIHPSFTYLERETELFKVIHAQYVHDIELFVAQTKRQIEQQHAYITGPPPNDVYQFSSLPLVDFTQITHTYAGKSEKSNPMFDWGKYSECDGALTIPFAIQVHHSFVDGIHVGYFVEELQQYLNDWW